MADLLARRGFLRQLAHLPLIGGGVTLLGNPTAAAVPALGAALSAPANPDAVLIALCRRCLERTDYVNTAALAENWSDEKVNAACDEIHAMEAQITAAVLVSVAAWSPRPGSFGAP